VRIAEAVARAVDGTRLYGPELPDLDPAGSGAPARVEVTGESTLAAARRLLSQSDEPVAALNFASARNPGGGFRNGADAQEESLCRASALYPCLLRARPYYERHRARRDPFYSDLVIFSPEVPVFRDDTGALLDRPYPVSFLTAAAPNAGVIARTEPGAAVRIPAVLRARSRLVLAVAAREGIGRLVLGAWGCGVFRNRPEVAGAFASHLRPGGEFANRFGEVVFAVLDRARGAPVRSAFAAVLGTG
jgi:uncharacterized protein (TIGR02452 family)